MQRPRVHADRVDPSPVYSGIDLAAEFIIGAAANTRNFGLNADAKNLADDSIVWGEEWLDGTDRSDTAQSAVLMLANRFAGAANMMTEQAREGDVVSAIVVAIPPEARSGEVAKLYKQTAPEFSDLIMASMSFERH